MNNDDKIINITSYNQSGGITAYEVNNFGTPQRHLTDSEKADIKQSLEELFKQNGWDKTKLLYGAIPTDDNSYLYGEEVGKYLISLGYKNITSTALLMSFSSIRSAKNYEITTVRNQEGLFPRIEIKPPSNII